MASNTVGLSNPLRQPVLHSFQPKVVLENSDLWRSFNEFTTEMIVTKPGRRMFPTLRYAISSLDPNGIYDLLLGFVPVDKHRYKFHGDSQQWTITPGILNELADKELSKQRICSHPNSPNLGSVWMSSPVSFHQVKLSNHASRLNEIVLLASLRKYLPRLYIVQKNSLDAAGSELILSASFPETAFIASTAYQNEKITELKILHNPYAKGFRGGKNPRKKRRPSSISPFFIDDATSSSIDTTSGEAVSSSSSRLPQEDNAERKRFRVDGSESSSEGLPDATAVLDDDVFEPTTVKALTSDAPTPPMLLSNQPLPPTLPAIVSPFFQPQLYFPTSPTFVGFPNFAPSAPPPPMFGYNITPAANNMYGAMHMGNPYVGGFNFMGLSASHQQQVSHQGPQLHPQNYASLAAANLVRFPGDNIFS